MLTSFLDTTLLHSHFVYVRPPLLLWMASLFTIFLSQDLRTVFLFQDPNTEAFLNSSHNKDLRNHLIDRRLGSHGVRRTP